MGITATLLSWPAQVVAAGAAARVVVGGYCVDKITTAITSGLGSAMDATIAVCSFSAARHFNSFRANAMGTLAVSKMLTSYLWTHQEQVCACTNRFWSCPPPNVQCQMVSTAYVVSIFVLVSVPLCLSGRTIVDLWRS